MMDKQMREILVRDSRSENMTRRLLEVPVKTKEQRQRRLLLAASGVLLRARSGPPATGAN